MTQPLVELNRLATLRRTVVQRSGGNPGAEHFFKAESLRAQLNSVGIVRFWLAAFVLDEKRLRRCAESGP